MNTSAKGSAYENEARRKLEANGCVVMRSAKSGGPFDLFAWRVATERLGLFQCKAGRLSCAGAQRLADALPVVPSPCETFVVHRCHVGCRVNGHVEQRFCLHSSRRRTYSAEGGATTDVRPTYSSSSSSEVP